MRLTLKEIKKYRKHKPKDKREDLFCRVCGCDIRWKKSNRVICQKPDCYKIYDKQRKAEWFKLNKKRVYKVMYKWRKKKRLEKKAQKDKEFMDKILKQAKEKISRCS